jgi:hypothetical protein
MRKLIIVFIAIMGAAMIVFISIARANLERVMHEIKEDTIRVMPVEYVTDYENGEQIKSTYYLPIIKILPSNVLYPIKIWRDKLWLLLTRDSCEKSELLMLIADKQMAEDDSLSASDAVDKLILAWKICPSNRQSIFEAAKAYRQMTQKVRKYTQANEKIQKFIEKETQN